MRFYQIVINGLNPAIWPARYVGDGFGGGIWGTESHMAYDTSAQQIEFQIEEARPNLPSPVSVLTVHGVSFEQIVNTGALVDKPISVYGGMHPAPAPDRYHVRPGRNWGCDESWQPGSPSCRLIAASFQYCFDAIWPTLNNTKAERKVAACQI
jgi:hypothetical protein